QPDRRRHHHQGLHRGRDRGPRLDQRRLHRLDARGHLRGARHAVGAFCQHRDRLRGPRPRPRRPAAGPPGRNGMTAATVTAAAERATSAVAGVRNRFRRLAPDAELYADSAKLLRPLSLAAIVFVALFPLWGSTLWTLRLEQGLYFGLVVLSLNILVGTA